MVSDELERSLAAFVGDAMGPELELAGLHDSDGHAGLTYLFETRRRGSGEPAGRYVLKLAPKGVARRGNTDVYRQAPLLRALHAAGLPVPSVPFASEDERAFGVPYLVMDRMPGRVYFVWDPHESFVRAPGAAAPLWRQCAEVLPRFHRFDWRTHLAGWQEPEPLLDQVKRWQKIYRHSPVPDWIARAERVEELLLASLPEAEPVGLFHGDYQPGNALYESGRLVGIVDWELSGIGAQLLDVGWLMMAADPESFVDEWHPIHPIPCDEIRAIYEAGMGRRFDAIPWFQAFAGYRLASIGCLNVKLHRTGRRVDPTWERIALGVAQMFERARAILSR